MVNHAKPWALDDPICVTRSTQCGADVSTQRASNVSQRLMSKLMSYDRTHEHLQVDLVGIGLAATTVIGWGLFIYSVLSTGAEEHALQREVSHLRQQIETVTAERDQQAKGHRQVNRRVTG